MKLQLDTNAMLHLFPEGSEARLDLQSAVIANLTKRIFNAELEKQILPVVENTIRDCLEDIELPDFEELTRKICYEYVTKKSYGSKLSFLGEMTALKMADLAEDTYRDQLLSKASTVFNEMIERECITSADLIKQAKDHLDNYKENLLNYVLEQEPEILQELLTKLINRKENGTN